MDQFPVPERGLAQTFIEQKAIDARTTRLTSARPIVHQESRIKNRVSRATLVIAPKLELCSLEE